MHTDSECATKCLDPNVVPSTRCIDEQREMSCKTFGYSHAQVWKKYLSSNVERKALDQLPDVAHVDDTEWRTHMLHVQTSFSRAKDERARFSNALIAADHHSARKADRDAPVFSEATSRATGHRQTSTGAATIGASSERFRTGRTLPATVGVDRPPVDGPFRSLANLSRDVDRFRSLANLSRGVDHPSVDARIRSYADVVRSETAPSLDELKRDAISANPRLGKDVDVLGSGDCMFRAFLVGAFFDESFAHDRGDDVIAVKRRVTESIRENWQHDQNFIDTDAMPLGLCDTNDLRTCRDVYVQWMQQQGEWGGHLELLTLAKLFAVSVWVYDVSRVTWTHTSADRPMSTVILLYYNQSHYHAYVWRGGVIPYLR